MTSPGEPLTVTLALAKTANISIHSSRIKTRRQIIVHGEVVFRGLGGRLATGETLPCLVAFVDDLGGVFSVLGFAREGECVLGLTIG